MIDFHTHVLPGMDDGSDSVEMSLSMLKRMGTATDTVVATPHFYLDKESIDSFLQRRKAAFDALHACMDETMPHMLLGAEVLFFEELSYLENVRELAIGATNYLLLEMPFSPWSNRTFNALYNLIAKCGLVPIIAHVERYLSLQDPQKIERLFSMEILIQMNASYLLQRSTRRKALQFLKKNQVHLLGSDCHNLTSRPPDLAEAYALLEKKLGPEFGAEFEKRGQSIIRLAGEKYD